MMYVFVAFVMTTSECLAGNNKDLEGVMTAILREALSKWPPALSKGSTVFLSLPRPIHVPHPTVQLMSTHQHNH